MDTCVVANINIGKIMQLINGLKLELHDCFFKSNIWNTECISK